MQRSNGFLIRVDGQLVAVSKDVYLAYYRSKRRDRYFERDIKTETLVRDKHGAIIGYRPSREDSLERLMAAGESFADSAVDAVTQVVSASLLDKLHEALAMLPDAERELIDALFFSDDGRGMTERGFAAFTGVPWQTVHSRKVRILAKLKKILSK